MKYFLRPYRYLGLAVVLGVGAWVIAAPPGAPAQIAQFRHFFQQLNPVLSHSGTPGYLGVLVGDVDNDSAPKLKLKEVRGALITLIDHDAPAGQAGLKVNDVVLELNGQTVEGAEQFGRMLREIPAGRKVNIVISRDGATQTMTVELCDRKIMEQAVWNKMKSGDGLPAPSGMGILTGTGDAGLPGFHVPFFGSTLNVGALVEPLTSQMADYLGVASGIMVKQVARKSEAAAAGLKAFDVILKVGTESITTTADWDRALRTNLGKPVQVTILRDKKQQTVNLQVDSKHKSAMELMDLFPEGTDPVTAELLLQDGPETAGDAAASAEALLGQAEIFPLDALPEQAEELQKQAEKMSQDHRCPYMDQRQMDEFKRQMEQFRQNFKMDDFKVDPKQMEEFKRQMEQFRQNFKMDDFKIEPKQMDELNRQMEQFRQTFKMDDFKVDPKQMEELKRQMEELRKTMPQFQMDRRQLDELKRRLDEMRTQSFGEFV